MAMKGKTVVLLAVVAGVALIGWQFHRRADRSRKNASVQPSASAVPVSAAAVVQKAVPVELRTFGTVQALSTVSVKSQITGVLTNVYFTEGQDVRQGDLLFTIDPRPLEAALKQAEASLARDTAQYENALREVQRQEELLKKGFTSEEARDQARTAEKTLAAALRADEAEIENAKLQLGYCFIRAPVTGRTGELMVHQGNLVKANDVTLVTINQIKPIQVRFAAPQQELPGIMDGARRAMEATTKSNLAVRAFVPGDEDKPDQGELAFVDNAVNPATGTIDLKATFANDHGRLWPGQFVNVVLTLLVQPDAIVIPSAAVQTGQKGTYVFVVKPDRTAESRPITVERTYDDETVVSAGLTSGERVVTDGQFRLGPGTKVEIKSGASQDPAKQP